MKLKYLLLTLIAIFFINQHNFAQRTNFELVDSLVLLSARDIAENEDKAQTFAIEFNGSSDYLVLRSKIITNLQNYGFSLTEELESSNILYYNIDEIKINYSQIFKDGIFGGYLVKRSASLQGSYYVNNSNILEDSKTFSFTLTDSVLLSEISNLENIAYSFTRADLPEEPFFSSALEPVIAIGTAAVAVYLFFNIRSK